MGTEFGLGAWVSLSRDSFTRALSLWITPGREREQPYLGWMPAGLPLYQPPALSLKARARTQAVGQRPLVEPEPAEIGWQENGAPGSRWRACRRAPRRCCAPYLPRSAHPRYLARLSAI